MGWGMGRDGWVLGGDRKISGKIPRNFREISRNFLGIRKRENRIAGRENKISMYDLQEKNSTIIPDSLVEYLRNVKNHQNMRFLTPPFKYNSVYSVVYEMVIPFNTCIHSSLTSKFAKHNNFPTYFAVI